MDAEARSSAIKMHCRRVILDGTPHTILSPRPSITHRFANNVFHGNVHVIVDPPSAQLFGRLMWAMSYQRHAHTIVLIDEPLLVPNPFDGDASSPIVIANKALGSLTIKALRQLRTMAIWKRPSDGTVKLQTGGLDRAITEAGADPERLASGYRWNAHQLRGWTDQLCGTAVVSAYPPMLREWGRFAYTTGVGPGVHMEERMLRHSKSFSEFAEVQVFDDFDEMLARAQRARADLFPGSEGRQLDLDERKLVWAASLAARPVAITGPAAVVEPN